MKEDEVYLQLSCWLMNHGINVMWNKKNDHGFKVFSTKGEKKKPDLIIESLCYGECVCAAVEVKIEEGRDIRSARKILDYYDACAKKKIKYIDEEGKELFPKYFLVATKHTPNGRLFKDDKIKELVKGSGREQIIKKYKTLLPQKEYMRTFDYVRSLWAEFKARYDQNKDYKIGVLLSGVLDEQSNHPMIFCMQHNGKMWRHQWKKITTT